jgi:hypothetical protein
MVAVVRWWVWLGTVRPTENTLGSESDCSKVEVLVGLLGLVRKAALLDDQRVQAQLHLGALHNSLLDGALGDQAEHPHHLGLPNAVGAVLRLQVGLRVPVTAKSAHAHALGEPIIDDNNIGRCKVDAEPTGTGAQHEHELVTARGVVLVDHAGAVVVCSLTVEAAVAVPAPPAIVLQDIQHTSHLKFSTSCIKQQKNSNNILEKDNERHLAKDEDAGALLLELDEQLVQHNELATVCHNPLKNKKNIKRRRGKCLPVLEDMEVGGIGRPGLGAVEEVGVVAALAQLHEDVEQPQLLDLAGPVENVQVLHENLRSERRHSYYLQQ